MQRDDQLLEQFLKCLEADKFLASGYTQEVRFNIYRSITCQSKACEQQLERVFKILLEQSEGEKDPRNLIILFEFFVKAFPLVSHDLQQKTWDLFSAYFPLNFTANAGQLLIDGEALSNNLVRIVGNPLFVSEFIALIFEKIRGDEKERAPAIHAANFWIRSARDEQSLIKQLVPKLPELE